jgi:hypothetical protein
MDAAYKVRLHKQLLQNAACKDKPQILRLTAIAATHLTTVGDHKPLHKPYTIYRIGVGKDSHTMPMALPVTTGGSEWHVTSDIAVKNTHTQKKNTIYIGIMIH